MQGDLSMWLLFPFITEGDLVVFSERHSSILHLSVITGTVWDRGPETSKSFEDFDAPPILMVSKSVELVMSSICVGVVRSKNIHPVIFYRDLSNTESLGSDPTRRLVKAGCILSQEDTGEKKQTKPKHNMDAMGEHANSAPQNTPRETWTETTLLRRRNSNAKILLKYCPVKDVNISCGL